MKSYKRVLVPTEVAPLEIRLFSLFMAHLQAQHNPGSCSLCISP